MTARRASEAPFPYGWPGKVCYFQALNESVWPVTTRDEMREAVHEALTDDVQLYAAWPGQYRTDLFWIDEPQRLADALGLSRDPVAS